jgi:hypothetical protein
VGLRPGHKLHSRKGHFANPKSFRTDLAEGVRQVANQAPDLSLQIFEQGTNLVVPDIDGSQQAAKDHGNLMDEGVAEVEKEAEEAAGGQPTGAAAFSEAQVAEASESQKAQNGPSKPTEANRGSDEQAAELLAEQIAEGQESVT